MKLKYLFLLGTLFPLSLTAQNWEEATPCPTETIHVFYEGEDLDFKYQKIGMVEVKSYYKDSNVLQDELVGKAHALCANAIILVRVRRQNEDLSFFDDETDYETVKYLEGIAVWVDKDAAFLRRHGVGYPAPVSLPASRSEDDVLEDVGFILGLVSIGEAILSVFGVTVVILLPALLFL